MMLVPNVIHRVELPIDDFPHGIDLVGDILHAAVRRPGKVDVWYKARCNPTVEHMRRSFQIVATGQPIPIWLSRHHATAISPDGQLVWHVLENHCPHAVDTTDPEQATGSVPCQACRLPMVGDGQGGWVPR